MKKETKNLPVIETEWQEQPPEYCLRFRCPNKKCKRLLDEMEVLEYLKINEGRKMNRIVTCQYCKTKFRLVVKKEV